MAWLKKKLTNIWFASASGRLMLCNKEMGPIKKLSFHFEPFCDLHEKYPFWGFFVAICGGKRFRKTGIWGEQTWVYLDKQNKKNQKYCAKTHANQFNDSRKFSGQLSCDIS